MRRRDFLRLSAGSAIATVAGTNAGMAQTALPMIKHIVVLMLENRSFDNLLGRLYPNSDGFDGLSGNEPGDARDQDVARFSRGGRHANDQARG